MKAHRERLVSTFRELAEMRSPLMEVRKIVNHLRALLAAEFNIGSINDTAGKGIPGYEMGNLICTPVPGTRHLTYYPIRGLEAHVDTVAVPIGKPITTTVDSGIIRTAGTTILGADDKAGVAAIIEALRMLKESGLPHLPFQILFTVGEERSMYGVKELNYGLLEAQSMICVDGLSVGELWRGCAAKLKYRATFFGKEGHGAFPEKGLNAVVMAAHAVTNCIADGEIGTFNNPGIIRGEDLESTVWHNLSEFKSDLNAGSAFPATNVIPAMCTVAGELRAFTKERLETVFEVIRHQFDATASGTTSGDGLTRGAAVHIETEYPYEPFTLPESHLLVQNVLRAMRSANTTGVTTGTTAGATHANVFNMHGIPSVVLGAGARNPHQNDEYVVIDEMAKAAEVIACYLTTAPPEH